VIILVPSELTLSQKCSLKVKQHEIALYFITPLLSAASIATFYYYCKTKPIDIK